MPGMWEDDCSVCGIAVAGDNPAPRRTRCPSCRDWEDYGEDPSHLQSAQAILAQIEANPDSSIDYGKTLAGMKRRVAELEGYNRPRQAAR